MIREEKDLNENQESTPSKLNKVNSLKEIQEEKLVEAEVKETENEEIRTAELEVVDSMLQNLKIAEKVEMETEKNFIVAKCWPLEKMEKSSIFFM